MLQKTSEQIADCLARAAKAREKAELASNPTIKANHLDAELRWLHLAESYRFLEQAERFVANADVKKRSADDPE